MLGGPACGNHGACHGPLGRAAAVRLPRNVVPCRAMPCHAVPCRAMPCRAVPCHAMPRNAMPCPAMPCLCKCFLPLCLQGISVSDSLYSKVVKELCTSRGAIWSLR